VLTDTLRPMSDATTVVTCQTCGRTLDESPSLTSRPPCPGCGSTARHVKVSVQEEIKVRSQVAVKARREDRGRPFREIKQGDDLHRKSGRWNILSRLIDHEQDLYEERIVDGESGEVIKDIREPLSQHRGHGSARGRRIRN
jgi:DNA-directed RNA polymerase subunit RPC12/RpoP